MPHESLWSANACSALWPSKTRSICKKNLSFHLFGFIVAEFCKILPNTREVIWNSRLSWLPNKLSICLIRALGCDGLELELHQTITICLLSSLEKRSLNVKGGWFGSFDCQYPILLNLPFSSGIRISPTGLFVQQ